MTSDAASTAGPPAPAAHREPFDPADVTWTPVSPRLARARLTVQALWFGPVVVVGAVVSALVGVVWVWIWPVLFAVVWLWRALLVPRQVRAMAYAERAEDLLIRHGLLFRNLVVVPYGRMQYVDVTAGPVDRRFGIATVQLHTASMVTGASISGLPPQEAARLRDRLASRGESRLAGL